MGNGVSSKKFIVVDGEKLTFSDIKQSFPKLLEELDSKNTLLVERERQIEQQNAEISSLRKEIHQLRCIVETKAKKAKDFATVQEDGEQQTLHIENKLKSLELNNFSRMDSKTKFLAVAVKAVRNKRFAVSGESGDRKSAADLTELPKHPKDSS